MDEDNHQRRTPHGLLLAAAVGLVFAGLIYREEVEEEEFAIDDQDNGGGGGAIVAILLLFLVGLVFFIRRLLSSDRGAPAAVFNFRDDSPDASDRTEWSASAIVSLVFLLMPPMMLLLILCSLFVGDGVIVAILLLFLVGLVFLIRRLLSSDRGAPATIFNFRDDSPDADHSASAIVSLVYLLMPAMMLLICLCVQFVGDGDEESNDRQDDIASSNGKSMCSETCCLFPCSVIFCKLIALWSAMQSEASLIYQLMCQ